MTPAALLRDLFDAAVATALPDRIIATHLPPAPDKMDPEALARMRRMIVPLRMSIEDVQGTWKLNQNKSDAARLAAADHLETSASGHELAALAQLMRTPPED